MRLHAFLRHDDDGGGVAELRSPRPTRHLQHLTQRQSIYLGFTVYLPKIEYFFNNKSSYFSPADQYFIFFPPPGWWGEGQNEKYTPLRFYKQILLLNEFREI